VFENTYFILFFKIQKRDFLPAGCIVFTQWPKINILPSGRKNYELDPKMNNTFYDGHNELYHHAKFGEDRTTRAGCRCENVVFVIFFVRHAPSP